MSVLYVGEGAGMEGVRKGGGRGIDRVLAEDYLTDLAGLEMAQVRIRRDEADQEEADLSYLRQVLHGRLQLVEDEIARRAAGEPVREDLIAHLTEVLTDNRARPAARGLGRHRSVEPSNPGESRRVVEKLVGDSLLTDLPNRSDEELSRAVEVLRDEETQVSARRRQVQEVADALGHEIGRRYRDGDADVSALLGPSGPSGT
jgi:hypothetical protein